jgi:hypothetical protein
MGGYRSLFANDALAYPLPNENPTPLMLTGVPVTALNGRLLLTQNSIVNAVGERMPVDGIHK